VPGCGGREAGVEHRRHRMAVQALWPPDLDDCGHVTHKTRTPLTLWFWAASLAATHMPGITPTRRGGVPHQHLETQPPRARPARTWVSARVAPGSIAHTDGWPGYARLTEAGDHHRPRLQRRDHPDAHNVGPRAHRAASNLTTWLQGTHRGVLPEHLQVYLDEFVFRDNRQRTPMAAFQTLVGLGALHTPTTYRQITPPGCDAARGADRIVMCKPYPSR
jgi:transposase-like protein